MPDAPSDAAPAPGRLGELARLFLKLGVIAFGGPAAHIAMLEDEVVTRRGWIDRQHFLDLIGATNLIPGPNSTEMTMHVGYERAGWPGLFVAGACFIGPAVLITGVLAWLYVRFGTLPAVEPFLFGIKPAVIAVILGALWRLARPAVKDWRFAVIGAGVAGVLLAGVAGEIVALLAGGVLGMLWFRATGRSDSGTADRYLSILFLSTPTGTGLSTPTGTGAVAVDPGAVAARVGAVSAGSAFAGATATAAAVTTVSLWKLFFFFLKVGAVLYGSGYVLVAFLEGGLVRDYGWLTQTQLMDAIAIGQLTPGPVLSTATFVGYVVSGLPGAAVATLGIFLPSFGFVLLVNRHIPRLRESAWMSAFLDAVNVAALGLMAAVTIQLGMGVLTSWAAWAILAIAAVLTLRYRVNAAWLVCGSALAGWFFVRFV